MPVVEIKAELSDELYQMLEAARGVRNASFADLENAPGVGPAVARRVYGHFHPDAAPHDTLRGAAAPTSPAAPKPVRDIVPAAAGTEGGEAPET